MISEELKEKIFNILGQVSMAWSEVPTGVFKADEAEKFGLELIQAIEKEFK